MDAIRDAERAVVAAQVRTKVSVEIAPRAVFS